MLKITQKEVSTKLRLTALDVTKGLVMIMMASLHCSFFFSEQLTGIPFYLFDPFVFSTFLLCFGIGNGISRSYKKPKVLGSLLVCYLIGGLPSAVVTYLLQHKQTGMNMISNIAYHQIVDALTLQHRLEYADFLVPFIVTYVFFLGLQFLFREFTHYTFVVALGLSSLFYSTGCILTQVAPDTPFQDFYNQGFRSLQSIPIFIAGVCLGLLLRHNGKMPVIKPRTFAWITLAFLSLILISHFQYDRHLYSGNLWKKSGELSYLIISIIVSTLFLFIIESFIKSNFVQKHFSLIIDLLEKIGKRTMKCLWIQLLVLPLTGYIVSTSFPRQLHELLSLVMIFLICWLTVNDRLSWDALPKKK